MTNRNKIREEIKLRIYMGNALYYSLRTFYPPACLPRNGKLIHIKLLLPVVLYGCETWSLNVERGAQVKGVRE